MNDKELTATESRLIHLGGSCLQAWKTQLTLLKSQNMNQLKLLQPKPMVGVLKETIIAIQILMDTKAPPQAQQTHHENGRLMMSSSKFVAKSVYLASLSL